MASGTGIKLTLSGVDKTKAMLATARLRMVKFGAAVKASVLHNVKQATVALGAMATAAVGIGYALRKAAQDFSVLSDRAAQIGETSDRLQRLSTALGVLGAQKADVQSIAAGLAKMTKETGRVGIEGLKQTLAEVSKLGTEAERVAELSRVFGRSWGPGLAALVRQGPEALQTGLDGVMAAMPGLVETSVQAGDDIADGFAIAGAGIKNGWESMIVSLGRSILGKAKMTGREVGATVGAYMTYYGQVVGENLGIFLHNFKEVFKLFRRDGEITGNFVADMLLYCFASIVEPVADIFRGIWEGIRGTFEGIVALFTDDTWSAAWDRVDQRWGNYSRDWRDFYDAAHRDLLKLAEDNPFKQYGIPEAARRQLEETLKAVGSLEESVSLAAQGSVSDLLEEAEESGKDVGKAFSNELKDAAKVEANSYEALKIMRQDRARVFGTGGASGGSGGNVAKQTAETSRNTSAILSRLAELLFLQKTGWAGVNANFAKLGVV